MGSIQNFLLPAHLETTWNHSSIDPLNACALLDNQCLRNGFRRKFTFKLHNLPCKRDPERNTCGVGNFTQLLNEN